MSGSGSTVFAIFKNYRKMEEVEDYFIKKNFWTYKASLNTAS